MSGHQSDYNATDEGDVISVHDMQQTRLNRAPVTTTSSHSLVAGD